MDELVTSARTLLSAARAGEDLEVYALDRTTTSVQAGTGGVVRDLASARTRGVGVRVAGGGGHGYASTSDLSPGALARVLHRAREHAQLAGGSEHAALPEPAATGSGPTALTLAATSVADKIALVVDLARRATTLDPRVRAIDTAAYRDEDTTVHIASTRGIDTTWRTGWAELTVDVLGEEGATTAADWGTWWGRDPTDADVDAVARTAVARTVRLLGAPLPMPRGLAVMLDAEPVAQLLSVLGRGLSGGPLDARAGPLAAARGGPVASAVLTLIDDGLTQHSPAEAPADDEGSPRRRTTLIDGGALHACLHDAGSAAVLGTTTTGNARRGSHRSPPGPGPTTLRLAPTGALAQVQAAAGDAILVQQLSGRGSGISAATGSVNVGAVGVRWRGGEAAGPVGVIPWSTSLSSLLRSVVAVGDDERVVPGETAFGATVICDPDALPPA